MKEVLVGTPVKSPLVVSGFKARKMFCDQILTLKDDPETIVRVSRKDQCALDRVDLPYSMGLSDHVKARELFGQLRDKYGLAVPRFNFVVGGDNQFYAVTERIHGQNLYRKVFKKSERSEAEEKLNPFYASLSSLLIDYCNTGGWGLMDITQNLASSSGNSQWVYGKRARDEEDKIWLVDLDPNVGDLEPYEFLFFCRQTNEQFPGLFRMIRESEIKLGCRFPQARELIFEYADSLLQTRTSDSRLVRSINEFMDDVKWADRLTNLKDLEGFYRL